MVNKFRMLYKRGGVPEFVKEHISFIANEKILISVRVVFLFMHINYTNENIRIKESLF
jgi:hypothetical protein